MRRLSLSEIYTNPQPLREGIGDMVKGGLKMAGIVTRDVLVNHVIGLIADKIINSVKSIWKGKKNPSDAEIDKQIYVEIAKLPMHQRESARQRMPEIRRRIKSSMGLRESVDEDYREAGEKKSKKGLGKPDFIVMTEEGFIPIHGDLGRAKKMAKFLGLGNGNIMSEIPEDWESSTVSTSTAFKIYDDFDEWSKNENGKGGTGVIEDKPLKEITKEEVEKAKENAPSPLEVARAQRDKEVANAAKKSGKAPKSSSPKVEVLPAVTFPAPKSKNLPAAIVNYGTSEKWIAFDSKEQAEKFINHTRNFPGVKLSNGKYPDKPAMFTGPDVAKNLGSDPQKSQFITAQQRTALYKAWNFDPNAKPISARVAPEAPKNVGKIDASKPADGGPPNVSLADNVARLKTDAKGKLDTLHDMLEKEVGPGTWKTVLAADSQIQYAMSIHASDTPKDLVKAAAILDGKISDLKKNLPELKARAAAAAQKVIDDAAVASRKTAKEAEKKIQAQKDLDEAAKVTKEENKVVSIDRKKTAEASNPAPEVKKPEVKVEEPERIPIKSSKPPKVDVKKAFGKADSVSNSTQGPIQKAGTSSHSWPSLSSLYKDKVDPPKDAKTKTAYGSASSRPLGVQSPGFKSAAEVAEEVAKAPGKKTLLDTYKAAFDKSPKKVIAGTIAIGAIIAGIAAKLILVYNKQHKQVSDGDLRREIDMNFDKYVRGLPGEETIRTRSKIDPVFRRHMIDEIFDQTRAKVLRPGEKGPVGNAATAIGGIVAKTAKLAGTSVLEQATKFAIYHNAAKGWAASKGLKPGTKEYQQSYRMALRVAGGINGVNGLMGAYGTGLNGAIPGMVGDGTGLFSQRDIKNQSKQKFDLTSNRKALSAELRGYQKGLKAAGKDDKRILPTTPGPEHISAIHHQLAQDIQVMKERGDQVGAQRLERDMKDPSSRKILEMNAYKWLKKNNPNALLMRY